MSESGPDDPKRAPRGPFGPPAPGRFGRSLMSWVIIIGLAVVLMTFLRGMDQRTEIGFSDFMGYLKNDLIAGKIILKQGEILATLSDDAEGLKENQSRKLLVHFLPSAHGDISRELRDTMGASTKVTLEERLPAWWEGL
ncbi:MAG: hypothetical protein J7M14_02765, partial [Planctomycetes bacterium]|nr:hypothetical protein [Planctomycetota bacterium]